MHDNLIKKAKWLRNKVLEKVIETKGKGHIGSTFSCIELLIALYYGNVLHYDPKNPNWEDRDRFVLGKGHVCLALYNILADLDFFDFSLIKEYGTIGGKLGVQLNIETPGIEYNTGSLGNAIGIAAGMALAAKLDNKKYKSFAMIGDGECQEGSVWETLTFASQQKLNNLICIVDRNKLGVTDFIEDNLKEKALAYGWAVTEINGHSFDDIFKAFFYINKIDMPFMIIADTIKGKGVSFMENNAKWHNATLTKEEEIIARRELQ